MHVHMQRMMLIVTGIHYAYTYWQDHPSLNKKRKVESEDESVNLVAAENVNRNASIVNIFVVTFVFKMNVTIKVNIHAKKGMRVLIWLALSMISNQHNNHYDKVRVKVWAKVQPKLKPKLLSRHRQKRGKRFRARQAIEELKSLHLKNTGIQSQGQSQIDQSQIDQRECQREPSDSNGTGTNTSNFPHNFRKTNEEKNDTNDDDYD